MFRDGVTLLTRSDSGTLPTVTAIERQIVRRLALHVRRDPDELEDELRAADRELPVSAWELEPILDELERDFAVRLPGSAALSARMEYVRQLALAIQGQMLMTLGSPLSEEARGAPG